VAGVLRALSPLEQAAREVTRQQRECTVGTWVGATVGRGEGVYSRDMGRGNSRGGGAGCNREAIRDGGEETSHLQSVERARLRLLIGHTGPPQGDDRPRGPASGC